MGRRVQKTVYAYASSTQSWELSDQSLFVYDGWNLVEELDADENIQKSYVCGLDLSQTLQGAGGVGGLLAVVDDAVTYLYSYDGNGNVGQVIDAADGSIGAHYEYDPYGNLLNQTGDYADENVYRFSSKYFDQENSLYYYGYRYYSAELGRWINRDPIAELGGYNLYCFVRNGAINESEMLGLATWPTASAEVRQGGSTGYVGYYGNSRTSENGSAKFHAGVDIIGNQGDRIQAYADGVVYIVGDYNDNYGKKIVIKHYEEKNGNETVTHFSLYAHLSCINVKVNEAVEEGQKIGEMGKTGNASAVHLHFEIRQGENYATAKKIDPALKFRIIDRIAQALNGFQSEDDPMVIPTTEYKTDDFGKWIDWMDSE